MPRIKTSIQFIKEGNVIVDVDRQLAFLTEITSTHQHPDLVIGQLIQKKVIIAELTIPFEVNIDWVRQQNLDIGCRGLISNSTSTF